MNEAAQWTIPIKTRGQRAQKRSDKWDTNYIRAVQEIAAEVSVECGRKIGFATLNVNLAIQRGQYFTEVRRRLAQRVKQLNKESKRHAHSTNQQIRRSKAI